jgi:hypothetical protein
VLFSGVSAATVFPHQLRRNRHPFRRRPGWRNSRPNTAATFAADPKVRSRFPETNRATCSGLNPASLAMAYAVFPLSTIACFNCSSIIA